MNSSATTSPAVSGTTYTVKFKAGLESNLNVTNSDNIRDVSQGKFLSSGLTLIRNTTSAPDSIFVVFAKKVDGRLQTISAEVNRRDLLNGQLSSSLEAKVFKAENQEGQASVGRLSLEDVFGNDAGSKIKEIDWLLREEFQLTGPTPPPQQKPNTPSPSSRPPVVGVRPPLGRDLAELAKGLGASQFHVMSLPDGKTVAGYNHDQQIVGPASTIKLVVADLVARQRLDLNKQINISREIIAEHENYKQGQKMTLGDALKLMLQKSDNSATNLLVRELGGPGQPINSLMSKYGYSKTQFHNYLSIPNADPGRRRNTASALEVGLAMKNLFTATDPVSVLAKVSLSNPDPTCSFGTPDSVANKIGITSKMMANVAVVEISGKKYIVSSFFANREGDEKTRMSWITKLEKEVCSRLRV